jgi:hypothetical protein
MSSTVRVGARKRCPVHAITEKETCTPGRIHDQYTKAATAATVALGLAFGALAAPASAATQHTAVGGPQSRPDALACPVTAFGYGGEAICGTQEAYYPDQANSTEDFVIGLDWSVWHAWPGSNGWHSLGGQADHIEASWSGVFLYSLSPEIIRVWGTDGHFWCDKWGIPTWSNWKPCTQF